MSIMKKGFTIIELLVVISIIGILVTLTSFALNQARQSARDARRQSDLEMIRSALELYRSDNGAYPANLNALTSGSIKYMTVIPTDPTPGRQYPYTWAAATPLVYQLCAALEGNTTAAGCSGSCGASATCSYRVTNP